MGKRGRWISKDREPRNFTGFGRELTVSEATDNGLASAGNSGRADGVFSRVDAGNSGAAQTHSAVNERDDHVIPYAVPLREAGQFSRNDAIRRADRSLGARAAAPGCWAIGAANWGAAASPGAG